MAGRKKNNQQYSDSVQQPVAPVKRNENKLLVWNGGLFSYRCSSGNEYSADKPNQVINVKTQKDFEELLNDSFLKKFLQICNC